MSNRTLLDDIQNGDDFPLPSTSLNENATLLSVEETNVTTTEKPFQIPELAKFIDRNPWVVYVVVAALTFCVFVIVFILLKSLCRKKKQVIQQDDDPVLTSTYDDGTSNICYRLFCCRWNQESNFRVRQNSESNLDPYKRPPLPPIGMKDGEMHYISPFSSNGLSTDEKYNAIHINAIRGVQHMPQKAEHYRVLPPLNFPEPPKK